MLLLLMEKPHLHRGAVDQAEYALERARDAARRVENAATFSDAETAWSDFIGLSQRIHSKLEQGAKGESQSLRWWGEIQHNRRTDPVLRYIHHARNADHHGIAPVIGRDPARIALGVGGGRWKIDAKFGSGELDARVEALGGQVPGQSKFVEVTPGSIRLVEVVDRGVHYEPPRGEDGNLLAPSTAAQLAVDLLTKIVEGAKRLPEHS